MPAPLSAVDAITPAMESAKRQLFHPVRWGRWARLAVVSLLSGEFAGGGSCGGGNFNLPHRGGGKSNELFALALPGIGRVHEWLPLIVLAILAVGVLILLWIYVASVFRFILFDSVLYDRCEISAGWKRSKQAGYSYFLWWISFTLVVLAAFGVLVGAPLGLAWGAGILERARENLALLIVGGGLLFLVLLALGIASAVVGLLAKDFLIPLMALEDLRVMEAWRRLLPMLKADKGGFVFYVLMKIVLAIAAAIVFGILNLIVLLAVLIPLGIAVAVVILAAKAAGMTWGVFTVGLAVVSGVALLASLIYLVAFVSTPAAVFFQAYTIHFFGGRYPKLAEHLTPPTPSPSGPPSVTPVPTTV